MTIAGEIKASDGGGDAATIDIKLGQPLPATQMLDPAVAECSGYLQQDGSDLTRTVAVPVEVDAVVTSSMSVGLRVDLSYVSEVAPNGSIAPPLTFAWAKEYSDGPTCAGSVDGTSGEVNWTSAAPGASNSFHAWLLLPNAMTPNDPLGREESGSALLTPLISMGDSAPAGVTLGYTGASAQVVTCSQATEGFLTYLAVTPAYVSSRGCKPGTGS